MSEPPTASPKDSSGAESSYPVPRILGALVLIAVSAALVWQGMARRQHAGSRKPTTSATVLFQDDFSSATGAVMTQWDGGPPEVHGTMHSQVQTFATQHALTRGRQRSPRQGHLALSIVEDDHSHGPDGKPGLLRLTIDELPHQAESFGFLYAGNDSLGEISFPEWPAGKVTRADLERMSLSFSFRADNLRFPGDYGVTLRLSLQPVDPDSLHRAADFGPLHATQEWRHIKRPLSSVDNVSVFLIAVNENPVSQLRLVWSQVGPVHKYAPGDALLIDDVRITYE